MLDMTKRSITNFLNKPFIWSIFICIYLAYLYPEIGAKNGIIKPEITVKYIAVAIIFFISGLSLRTKELITAASQYHVHSFIQLYTLCFTPLFVQMFVLLLEQFYFNPELLQGFITVSCLPPPVSSAVLLTKAADGNEAAAVFNSVFGSFLGIFVTPVLLLIFLSNSPDVVIGSAVLQLLIVVLLPLILGQLLRHIIGNHILIHKKKLSICGSCMLLLIIYTTFCDTFSAKIQLLSVSTLVVTILLVIILQLILMAIIVLITSNFNMHYLPGDIVAILFCSTHKSLTLGFPMLKVLYGQQPRFFLISFPLLVYHPTQILIGSLLSPALQQWLQKTQNLYKRRMYPV